MSKKIFFRHNLVNDVTMQKRMIIDDIIIFENGQYRQFRTVKCVPYNFRVSGKLGNAEFGCTAVTEFAKTFCCSRKS